MNLDFSGGPRPSKESRIDRQIRKKGEHTMLAAHASKFLAFTVQLSAIFTFRPRATTLHAVAPLGETTLFGYGRQLRALLLQVRQDGGVFDTPQDLDDFIEAMAVADWEDGKSMARPGVLRSALHKLYPDLRGVLLRSGATIAGMRRMSPPESATSCPSFLLGLFLQWLCDRRLFEIAEMAVVHFDSLLRREEVAKLTSASYVPCDASAGHTSLGVLLMPHKRARNETTKGRRDQTIRISIIGLHDLLWRRTQSAKQHGRRRLVVCSSRVLYIAFRDFIDEMGLAHFNFSIHSFRHGGAAHLYLCGVPIDTIVLLGRWKSVHSMQTYLDSMGIALQQVAAAVSIFLRSRGDSLFAARYSLLADLRVLLKEA